jgi:hypothetical protein
MLRHGQRRQPALSAHNILCPLNLLRVLMPLRLHPSQHHPDPPYARQRFRSMRKTLLTDLQKPPSAIRITCYPQPDPTPKVCCAERVSMTVDVHVISCCRRQAAPSMIPATMVWAMVGTSTSQGLGNPPSESGAQSILPYLIWIPKRRR